MRKTLLTIVLALAGIGAGAQQADSTRTAAMQQTIDSMKQVLSEQTKKAEQMETDHETERIWKRRGFMTVGIGKTSLDIEDPEFGKLGYKSQFAAGFTWGKTYYLHKKPIANMVKIGLDATWMDVSYARYKKGKGLKFNIPDEDDFDDIYDGGYDDYEDYDEELADIDLGMHQIEVGMGIGPSVTVTPFRPLNIKGLNYLKVAAYFHWMPSYSAVLRTREAQSIFDETTGMTRETEKETLVNHGYCNFFKFGLSLSWKALTIGFEHRWGSAKYNTESFDDVEDSFGGSGDGEESSPKMKHSTKTNRFFIGLRF